MKVIFFVAFLVAGVRAQYGIPDDDDMPEMSFAAPEPPAPVQSFSAPPPPALFRMNSYSAPVQAPAEVEFKHPRVEAPSPIVVRIAEQYAAPAPTVVRVAPTYEAPAPVVRVAQTYEAPAPVVRVAQTYEAPAPVVRVAQTYEAPAPVVRVVPTYESPATKTEFQSVENKKPTAQIVKLLVDNDNRGSYQVQSEGSDGSTSYETASLKDLGDAEGPVSVSRGSYSFVSDDGKTYKVDWTSDEQGFRATGAHIPVSPPIPAEIQKSLEQNAYAAAQPTRMETSSYDAAPAPAVRVVSSFPAQTATVQFRSKY